MKKKDKHIDVYELIAKNIKYYRKSRNMTQAELAEKTEYSHEFIRRIIPKSTDLGQYNQAEIDLMMDHINSYGRPELGDKSPYEMFEFYYGKEILDLLGVHKIPANEIILKPELLKRR